MNKRFRFVARVAAVPAALAVMAGSAMAAIPADVSTGLTDMKSDGAAMATGVLLAIVAVFTLKFLRRGL